MSFKDPTGLLSVSGNDKDVDTFKGMMGSSFKEGSVSFDYKENKSGGYDVTGKVNDGHKLTKSEDSLLKMINSGLNIRLGENDGGRVANFDKDTKVTTLDINLMQRIGDNAERLFDQGVIDPKAKYSGSDVFVHELSETYFKNNPSFQQYSLKDTRDPHENAIGFNAQWRSENNLFPIVSQGQRGPVIQEANKLFHEYKNLDNNSTAEHIIRDLRK